MHITLKGYFLNKCTYWLLVISVVIWIIVFATLNIPREDRFILSTNLTGAVLAFIMYLNRFEVKHIRLGEENFELEYFDQGKFFTRKDATCAKSEVTVLKTKDKFVLQNNSNKIATIRRKATDIDNWEILKKYFATAIVNAPHS